MGKGLAGAETDGDEGKWLIKLMNTIGVLRPGEVVYAAAQVAIYHNTIRESHPHPD